MNSLARGAGREPSPPLVGIRRLIDVRVAMRDGVRLSTDVYLPDGTEPVPAVLVRTPYPLHLVLPVIPG